MSLAVTGATGLVGRFFVEEALARGEPVTILGRTPPPPGFFSAPTGFRPYALGDRPDLSNLDALVHCAFAHLPGRYRGGEGGDPAGFTAANLDGSIALFETARAAGLRHLVFLSSRAVYGHYPPGTALTEPLTPYPDTLYGEVKARAETALLSLATDSFAPVALRATGVYGPAGPGRPHKWQTLFDDFRQGRPIAPRRGTEVHGADLAAAARLLRDAGARGVFNVSDILLDRHDLLALVAEAEGIPHPLPPRSDAAVSAMRCDRLAAFGWTPGGLARLTATIPALCRPCPAN
ncbi:NAD-dependent epimerase/dehydratase family protein [Rhodovulum visakhapatnamense]|uniref:Nucleoside-diphosphate-sugar epimerase n=1 Tax=Rhodovulum visakhapatnamense TaxID=364297 RepID=A0A4R8G895_9RHOB|nr:NAD(P)-dependent oxidoreductase [Rhodovulum visakhapatnamense]TDX32484.1 nucleoside-diphosphate-sugar epimerase [Rhodovulum visakhapatnamense]